MKIGVWDSKYRWYDTKVVDLSVEEIIIRYDKGTTNYGEVSGTSLNAHPRPGGDATGYYEYIGIK